MSHLLTLYGLIEVKMWEVHTGRLDTHAGWKGPTAERAPRCTRGPSVCGSAYVPLSGSFHLESCFTLHVKSSGRRNSRLGADDLLRSWSDE